MNLTVHDLRSRILGPELSASKDLVVLQLKKSHLFDHATDGMMVNEAFRV